MEALQELKSDSALQEIFDEFSAVDFSYILYSCENEGTSDCAA